MCRALLIPICALGLSGLAGGVAVMHKPRAEPAQATRPTTSDRQQTDVGKAGVWQPPSGLKQIPIWPPAGWSCSDRRRELKSRKPRMSSRGALGPQPMT